MVKSSRGHERNARKLQGTWKDLLMSPDPSSVSMFADAACPALVALSILRAQRWKAKQEIWTTTYVAVRGARYVPPSLDSLKHL
jgi:hypothetical protein